VIYYGCLHGHGHSIFRPKQTLIRYLEAPPYNKTIDIVNKDASFANSRENFKAAIAELKMMGLGDVKHYPAINETNRRKLYTSLYLSPKVCPQVFIIPFLATSVLRFS
jgi:hypothetical protein